MFLDITEKVIEELKEMNTSCRQPITEDIAYKVSELRRFRDELGYITPQVGDIVVYEDTEGRIYENAHIERVHNGIATICLRPYTPFVSIDRQKNSLSTSASGGSWTSLFIEDLTGNDVIVKAKGFCDFFNDVGASKAVQFTLPARVWNYKELREQSEILFESYNDRRTKEVLKEISQSKPKDIYEALKILSDSFDGDRLFTLSPMFCGDKKAVIKVFDRYEIYCYCDERYIWTIYDRNKKLNFN